MPITPQPWTIDANTIGLWHMNGTAGSAAKIDNAEGTAGYDISEVSSPTSTTGVVPPTTDGAYATNGTSYLSVPDGATLDTTNITVAGWFQTTTTSRALCSRYVAGGNRSFRVLITGGGKIEVICYDNSDNNSVPIDSTTTVTDGALHFWAFTFDGTTVKLYVDPTTSTPQATTTSISSLRASAAPFQIGRNVIESVGTYTMLDEWSYSKTAYSGAYLSAYYLSGPTATVNGAPFFQMLN